MDLFNSKKIKDLNAKLEETQSQLKKAVSAYYQPNYFYQPIYRLPYTGEKTPGEMGAAIDYTLSYTYLRVRSWEAYLRSEIAQSIINKYCSWVVGSGLKIQPEPVKLVLQQEGINFNDPEFVKSVETRFNLFTSSRYSDYSRMTSIDVLAFEAFKNSIIGGDVLVVLRVVNNLLTMQLIDGSHVSTPVLSDNFQKDVQARGNRIEYGIELSPTGEHIAYFVCDEKGKYQRIQRYGSNSGRMFAFMVYGNRYRIDNVRGLPLLSAVLETLKKLERYKEATVGSAEERQKIAYSIEHNADSTGENPLMAKLAQSNSLGFGEAPESKSVSEYEAASTKVASTTNKMAFNMPIGASLKLLESKNELYFTDFYSTNIQLVTASVGIPYEVAMSKFDSNYSASRAAIKDWEHSMKEKRENFSSQFYQPYYNLWFEYEVLIGKIKADGFLKAIMDNNIMAIEAYTSARWLGVNVPHIDPVKEVQAERLKLGDETTPLTTYDQATEALGSGDFAQNLEKVKQEKKLIPVENVTNVNKSA